MYSGGGNTSASKSWLRMIWAYTGPVTLYSFRVTKVHSPDRMAPAENTAVSSASRGASLILRRKSMMPCPLD